VTSTLTRWGFRINPRHILGHNEERRKDCQRRREQGIQEFWAFRNKEGRAGFECAAYVSPAMTNFQRIVRQGAKHAPQHFTKKFSLGTYSGALAIIKLGSETNWTSGQVTP
jgi:hypothetical protein